MVDAGQALRNRGISGPALLAVGLGIYTVWAGINNVGWLRGLFDLAQGKTPVKVKAASRPIGEYLRSGSGSTTTTTGGTSVPAAGALGQRIVTAARRHLGAPYVWGAAGPNTFDCSGLVSYVLSHDLGMPVKRMVTQEFLVWRGARTVPAAQESPGDLACWSGHIGICIGGGKMIAAPKPGGHVQIDKIWRAPTPLIRRVLAVKSA